MFKFRTIQSKLFISYASLILIIILIFITLFYFYTSEILAQRASQSIQQSALNISDKFDAELKNMNSIAERVVNSTPVKNVFFESTVTEASQLHNKWEITSLLFSITGAPFQFRQMNLFRIDGRFVEFGRDFDILTVDTDKINKTAWVKATFEMDGKKYISMPHKSDWDNSNAIVISVCRAFSEVFGARLDSIVEVQQEYSVFCNLIERSVSLSENSPNAQENVFVFDIDGNIIYPYEVGQSKSSLASYYWDKIKGLNKNSDTISISNQLTNQKDILAFNRSEFTQWTVVIAESEGRLLTPIRAFRNELFLFGLIMLFITMLVTFFVSKGLTIPIKKMRKSINNLNLQTLNPRISSVPTVNELEDLNNSFIEMCERLKKSLDDVVDARSHEIQARMLALQAQMNPHFLYNTLSVISIKAENSNEFEIVKMCENLSDMLRYVAVESTKPVSLKNEIDYTLKYLELMEIRHLNQFECNIDIPEEMYDIQVPRLIIQPLVENSFKHAFLNRPPWKINITGKTYNNFCEVTVEDNGTGFSSEFLNMIGEKILSKSFEIDLNNTENHRIGLLNICHRLQIISNDKTIIKISNSNITGGAMITIGGVILKGDSYNE